MKLGIVGCCPKDACSYIFMNPDAAMVSGTGKPMQLGIIQ